MTLQRSSIRSIVKDDDGEVSERQDKVEAASHDGAPVIQRRQDMKVKVEEVMRPNRHSRIGVPADEKDINCGSVGTTTYQEQAYELFCEWCNGECGRGVVSHQRCAQCAVEGSICKTESIEAQHLQEVCS